MRKAIDVSNYTEVPTPQQVACLVTSGYERAIVGASYGHVAHAQLAAFSEGGMDIEAYAWVSFKSDWQACIDRAMAACFNLPVKRLWLDCEEDPGMTSTLDRITQARAYAERGVYPLGIYTGGWWWKPNTGDWQGMNDLPLWSADYRDPSNANPSLYGGWPAVAIWQFAGSVTLCGLNADDNIILEEDDVTKEEFQALAGLVFQQQETIKSLQTIAYDHALRLNALEEKPK